MVKPPCCEKLSKRGVFTAEEDAKILAFVSKHGSGNQTAVPKKAGLRRCGKSCRLRWANYLRPDLKHDSFTPQEENLIVKLHAAIGSRWSIIAQQLPGRTDTDVKNYWNAKLRKKLSDMGIDPVTHKPFSKLIADYGNIGSLQKPSTRIGSLSKEFKNVILLNSEPYPSLPQGFRNINGFPKQPSISPKTQPAENGFFCSRTHTDNLSMDLAQLQTIPMMEGALNSIGVENEIIKAPIFVDGCFSSASSPSASTCSIAGQESLPLPFSWNDFLLEDAFPPAADNQEQEIMAGLLSKEFVNQIENGTQESANKIEVRSQQVPSNEHQFSSSSNNSFVEAMLDQENEMFLNFPHLMEDPSNY